MRKRITLEVDKLISRQPKRTKPETLPLPPPKALSFEQLYQMARKTSTNAQSRSIRNQMLLSSTQTNISDSLKGSRNTPQNSNRNRRQAEAHEKLNRSLETKSSSIEKQHVVARSSSSDRKGLIEKWKGERAASAHINKENKEVMNKVHKKEGIKEEKISPNDVEQFKTEYEEAIAQLDHSSHEHLRETECFLSIQETFHILRKLHYLRKLQDEKYLVKIWQELQGQNYSGVPSHNLFEFLTYINHYNTNNYYQKGQEKDVKRRLHINNNLKIVITDKGKLEIYEEYLALRVNRILYGGNGSDFSQKKLHRTSNIMIVDEESDTTDKRKVTLMPKKMSFNKQKPQENEQPLRRSVRLKSNDPKPAKRPQEPVQFDQTFEKDKSEDTICYSEISETKQSGKNLTSNESETSLHSELIEQVVIKKPILSVDVNLGDGVSDKIMVFQGETAFQVSQRLVEKYKIEQSLRQKFENMLQSHIRNLLWRIQEVSEELISDREE